MANGNNIATELRSIKSEIIRLVDLARQKDAVFYARYVGSDMERIIDNWRREPSPAAKSKAQARAEVIESVYARLAAIDGVN